MVFAKACKYYSDRKVISKIKAKLELNPEGRQTVFVFVHVGALHKIWKSYPWRILIGFILQRYYWVLLIIVGTRKEVMKSLFFLETRVIANNRRWTDELIISRVIIMAEVLSRRRKSSRAGDASNKLETEALSSFDYRDTSAIVLTAEENAILEASKEYAVSAGNLVRVLTTHLGNDRSSWGKDPNY